MYMHVVCFLAMQAPHRLCFIAKPTELADWIIDAVWLVYKDPSCYRVAFVTAHNAVLMYSVTGGSLSTATYQSEVNCILYPRVYHYYLPVSEVPLSFNNCTCTQYTMHTYLTAGIHQYGIKPLH